MKSFLPVPIFAAAVTALALGLTACSRQTETPKATASVAPAPAPKSVAPAPAPANATPIPAPASVAASPAANGVVAALPVLGPAPAWSLKDVNGQTVTSEQFKGKVVVVDFWATWCAPCRSEIPGYVDLQRKYGKDGLVIVGVSIDSDEHPSETVKTFVQKFGLNYQIVMGDETVQGVFGGLNVIPTTFLIDRAGQIRDRKEGAVPTEEYEKRITSLLN